MKKFILNLIFILLVSIGGYSQTGDGYINYRAVRTHYGNGTTSQYPSHAQNSAQFDLMFDLTNPANTLIGEGEVDADSQQGFAGGHPPYTNGTSGNVGGEYFAVEYTGWFFAKATGNYMFYLYTDDSSEVWIGDTKVASRYGGAGTTSGWITLQANTWYPLMMRYQEYVGGDYGHLQMYSSMFNGYFYPGHASYPVTNIDPNTPIDPEVDFQFEFNSNMEPEKIKFGVYYDASAEQNGSEWYNTSTTNSTYYLDTDGTKDVTDYLNLVKMSDGKKATTTGGSVEWCVVYDYDTTNKRYRVGIDKREFPSGFIFTDLKQLKLFDLWDGGITYMSDDSAWANYYIYTDTQFDFTNSTFSSYIRDANGFYGMKAEFSFEDVEIYKKHRLVFVHSQDLWNPQLFIDDYVTVADVVSAFSELAGGGINGGLKGDLNGIQLQNADVNMDGNFDFQDTFKLLKFLQGEENLTTYQRTSDIMRVIPKSEYDGTTTSNWKTQPNKGLNNTAIFELIYDSIQQPQYKVTFLGDINLSHSPAQNTVTSIISKVNSAPRLMSSKSETNSVDVIFDIEIENTETKTWVDDKIIVTLTVPQNQQNIIGSEFRIGFDNTRVTYDKLETNSNLQNFDAQRPEYIKLGSISTDGSKNLNGGVEYKIYFSPQQSFNSILGLVSIIKSELVTTNGEQVGVRIK